ncbi:sulfatase [Flammeovirga sp. EKP202]|uniref:sulfatase family protein n=1 Tax=Flammeovirga sp. EKP202 TaxID=2770592 RepID=UPI00165FA0CB|nr:sulfatase-like hydrolase/transferase [Flammeovirga sp. EKP202]MBD0404221.1 sulfatase-like hydrolase/transferase [Flammeovirga sp. EKP202]
MMKTFLYTLFIISIFGCSSPHTKTQVKSIQPNIVMIYVDDMELNQMSAFGCDMPTPHMDRIVNDGAKLNLNYVSAPVCTPSRYGQLTGRYASRCNSYLKEFPTDNPIFIRWNGDLEEHGSEKTVAHLLKENGYATGFVGKWHNGQPEVEGRYEDLNLDKKITDPDVAKQLKELYAKQVNYIKKASGFEYVESVYGNNLHALALPKEAQVHNQEWITKGGLDFIDQNKDKPFFLSFNTTIPHVPSPYHSMEADSRITPHGLLEESIDGKYMPKRADLIQQTLDEGFSIDYAVIKWLDEGIGAIYKKLDELNLTENTIIVFASDHGVTGKMTCYTSAALVPAGISWPSKIKKAQQINELTSQVDFVPTVLSAAGITLPKDYHADGIDLLPHLMEGKTLGRDYLYSEVVYQRAIITKDFQYLATRFPNDVQAKITKENRKEFTIEGKQENDRYNGQAKFPGYYDDDQLYDLKADPKEQNNLAYDPAYQAKLEEMKGYMKEVVSTFPHAFGEFGKQVK